MTGIRLAGLKRFFRSPATIVGEMSFITLLGGLGAALPQTGVATPAEVAKLRAQGWFLTTLVDALSLDHVFTSPAFLVVLGLATVSLAIVVVEQLRRLRAQWALTPSEAQFRSAPYRVEFTRPAPADAPPEPLLQVHGRAALAGSPLFHTGLLCVILAGVLRALFGVGAVVDLYEGETLPATAEAWGAQWPGLLAAPFHLDEPLVLVSVESARYGSGDLRSLRLKLAHAVPGRGEILEMGINQELAVSRGRLFVGAEHGPTALLEWQAPPAPPLRRALLLEQKEPQAFGAYAQGPGELRARIRVPMPADGSRPDHAEVRILLGHGVLAQGDLRPGEVLTAPGGASFRLHGLPTWARVHANHDPALPLAYLGFGLALLGAALMFGVVQVDEFVAVSREGDGERVVVALRPHRFAPLFKDRFERLVREHGGAP